MIHRTIRVTITCVTLVLLADSALAQIASLPNIVSSENLVDVKTTKNSSGKVTRGKFRVWENRLTKTGRQIHLNFLVLHAQNDASESDPFFFIVGGPGQASTTAAPMFQNHWIRQDRDIVMLDQRGTGGDNRLAFDYTEQKASQLQEYFDPIMSPAVVQRNLDKLSRRADLRMYSTPIAADDMDDFRRAMGYDKINIMGGSYGTRACLVYIRRHGEHVRTATLAGCAPIEFKNPLFHSQSAQRALDLMFEEAASTEEYRAAFGDLKKKLYDITERLKSEPAVVDINSPITGKSESITLSSADFIAAVRFQMYYTSRSRQLPVLLCRAYEGDFTPFVSSSLRQNMALRQTLALGMLLCVTSAEDVMRILPEEVAPLNEDTIFGSGRVRSQIAAAKLWPKSELPDGFGQPVKSNVPTLILSGQIDPVTPPKWGEKIHANFPNSVHLVFPTAHDINGPCVDQIRKQFLDSGTVKGLDTSCLKFMKLPKLRMPN